MGLLILLTPDEAVTATATWEQTQSWEATAAERFTGTASFEQTASWDAVAAESIPSTATWSQDASWAALGMSAEDVTAAATFEQAAASWAGLSTTADAAQRPRIGLPVRIRLHINGVGSFEQQPASWAADMSVVRRDADIEELLLVGAI